MDVAYLHDAMMVGVRLDFLGLDASLASFGSSLFLLEEQYNMVNIHGEGWCRNTLSNS